MYRKSGYVSLLAKDLQTFTENFLHLQIFARKFTNFPKKNLLIYIKSSKSNYQLKFEEKCKKIMKIQFLTSNVSKTMGQKNLKKFSGIQNKFKNIFGEF